MTTNSYRYILSFLSMLPPSCIYIMLAIACCNLLSCQGGITSIPEGEWILYLGYNSIHSINSCDVAVGPDGQLVFATRYSRSFVDDQSKLLFQTHGWNRQIALIKIDSSGHLIDRITIGNADAFVDFNSVETDQGGNIYISGDFCGEISFYSPGIGVHITADHTDGYLCKFNNDFECLWAVQSFVLANFAVADDGNVYAIADDHDTSGHKCRILKISVNGDIEWETEAYGRTQFNDIHVTHDGRILVVGDVLNGNTRIFQDVDGIECPQGCYPEDQDEVDNKSFLVEIDETGNCQNILWIPYLVKSIDSDSENICVAGSHYVLLTDLEYSGVWLRRWNSTAEFKINDVAMVSSGNIYATGMFKDSIDFDPGQSVDYWRTERGFAGFLVGLDNEGDYLGVNIWNDNSNSQNRGISIAEGEIGEIYVTGSLRAENLLMKFSENEMF